MAGKLTVKKPVLTWADVDGLEPRVTVTLGGTVPTAAKFTSAKAELSLSVTKHPSYTTEELVDQLTNMLADKWDELIASQAERVEKL